MFDLVARETAANIGSEFSEPVTLTPAGGSSRQIRAIYERLAEVADIGEMISMDGVAARLQVSDEDASGIALGDAAVVRSTDYRVVGVEEHRGGRTVLVLGL